MLSVAKAEVGYLEKKSIASLDHKTNNAGSKNYTKYARDLDAIKGFYNGRKQGTSWCDVFVDWCFVEAFGAAIATELLYQPLGGCGAGVLYSARYFQAKGRLVQSPQPGDQIFFGSMSGGTIKKGNHTGIVVEVRGGKVYTIEGNTSGASGVVSNGGGVCLKSYSLKSKQIIGYGRPDWNVVPPEPSTPPIQNIEEDDETMDVAKFKELWNEMRKELQDNDSGKWSEEALRWATSNGLVEGGGTQSNGEPNYMWEDLLTREQLIAVLYRFAKMLGKA